VTPRVPLTPGQTFARYTIEALLGAGGMSTATEAEPDGEVRDAAPARRGYPLDELEYPWERPRSGGTAPR
jgi:hypothetical protein